jgi:glycosyltransferase involved in cell wall biosynthesis
VKRSADAGFGGTGGTDGSRRSLRIAVIGSATFGFRQPFPGGMEAHTWDLVLGLRGRGHQVTVYAGPDSDPELGAVSMHSGRVRLSPAARQDVSMQPEDVLVEHLAYQRTMLALMRDPGAVDVVHLNCTHALPVVMAPALGIPVTATLHCPPTPWLELAHQEVQGERGAPETVVVSDFLAGAWRASTGLGFRPIVNGVDLRRWPVGDGAGGYAVWSGRLVPEKAPHLAVDAARRAGVPIVLAGPEHDLDYVRREIRPRLGPDVTYAGHLRQPDLARLVGSAAVALVTPAWDEPFGLVAAEAMACGTPVAAIGRGALAGLVTPDVGWVVAPGASADALAQALRAASQLDRCAVRRSAVERFDLRRMVRRYERLMLDAVRRHDRAVRQPVGA